MDDHKGAGWMITRELVCLSIAGGKLREEVTCVEGARVLKQVQRTRNTHRVEKHQLD